MKQFEYIVATIWETNCDPLQKELNNYGEKGWELVSKGRNDYQYIFKREKIINNSDTTI